MSEHPNERMARQIVAHVLGVKVDRFEDGTADGQVDAIIHGPSGPEALEIVADHDPAFNSQWDALTKLDHHLLVPELEHDWAVQLSRTARVKRVTQKLPALMVINEPDLTHPARRLSAVPEAMAKLGVRMVYTVDRVTPTGRIDLHSEGWSSPGSGETVVEYVLNVLDEAPDVAEKLQRHECIARHAFIWTTIGTDFGVQSQLELGKSSLPREDPSLPSGITHLWLAGSFNSQGVLAWFPDRGWWRPTYQSRQDSDESPIL